MKKAHTVWYHYMNIHCVNVKKAKVIRTENRGNFPAVQWLGLFASTAGSTGSNPCLGTKILRVVQCGPPQKKKMSKGQNDGYQGLGNCRPGEMVLLQTYN